MLGRLRGEFMRSGIGEKSDDAECEGVDSRGPVDGLCMGIASVGAGTGNVILDGNGEGASDGWTVDAGDGVNSVENSDPGPGLVDSQWGGSHDGLTEGTILAEIITTSSYLAVASPDRALGRVNHGNLTVDDFNRDCDSSHTNSPAINVQPS